MAGQRYGVATIAVTAEKKNTLGAVVAQSIARLVLATESPSTNSDAELDESNITPTGADLTGRA